MIVKVNYSGAYVHLFLPGKVHKLEDENRGLKNQLGIPNGDSLIAVSDDNVFTPKVALLIPCFWLLCFWLISPDFVRLAVMGSCDFSPS